LGLDTIIDLNANMNTLPCNVSCFSVKSSTILTLHIFHYVLFYPHVLLVMLV